MSLKTATAVIDLAALKRNFQFIKTKAPQSKMLAVLKANAYGHGLVRIAQSLSQVALQADAFGVARIDEALVLREAGIDKPIVLLEGFFEKEDLAVISANNLQTVIHNSEQLSTLCAADVAQPIKVWLKIDTGMHRLGIAPNDFQRFYSELKGSNNVDSSIVLMSHLGCADDLENKSTSNQIALFNSITADSNAMKSLANSAGINAWPNSHYQWVRPGLMLYGVSPMQNLDVENDQGALTPVMTLQSSLIAVREVQQGEYIGYGGAWQSERQTTIGVVAIGYGDGYPRHAKNGTPVLINKRIVPLIGRVSMDMITVDLGVNANDNIGDIVTLWGDELPVESIAKWATTIPYELLCNVSRRVKSTIKSND